MYVYAYAAILPLLVHAVSVTVELRITSNIHHCPILEQRLKYDINTHRFAQTLITQKKRRLVITILS